MVGGKTAKVFLKAIVGLSTLFFVHVVYHDWLSTGTRFLGYSSTDIVRKDVLRGSREPQKNKESTQLIDHVPSILERINNSSPEKNILFIIVDDLRPQFEPYTTMESFPIRFPQMVTPNFAQLASRSLVLTNAFVQFTLCGPSRTSILTGRRPDTTKVYHNKQYWRQDGYNFTTLPQLFKKRGYSTLCFGKVFHVPKQYDQDYPYSWSEPCIKVDPSSTPHYTEGAHPSGIWAAASEQDLKRNPLDDTVIAERVTRTLKEYVKNPAREPFFMAVGFEKPHLPFVCPKKFMDLYDLEEDAQYLTKKEWQTPTVRKGCNVANTTFIENQYSRMDEQTLRYYRRAYFGCVSYIDSLIGRLLKTLDELGLRDSTVVSVTADHGYHLGENGLFGKQTIHDIGSRVPMIISIPGVTDGGVISHSLVESIDLFPTLVEAAGLDPVPQCPCSHPSRLQLCNEGATLLPLIDHPDATHKTVVQTQVRPFASMMQYSVRTDRYRYAQWGLANNSSSRYDLVDLRNPRFQDELYDHLVDKEEIVNVATDDSYSSVRKDMRRYLTEMWEQQNS